MSKTIKIAASLEDDNHALASVTLKKSQLKLIKAADSSRKNMRRTRAKQ